MRASNVITEILKNPFDRDDSFKVWLYKGVC